LRQALASVRAIEGPDLTLEVIVADNGPDSETEAIAREFAAVYVPVSRPGPSATRNAGIAIAGCPYIAFLDDDDMWTREHLRGQLAFLSNNPEYAAAVGQVVRADESGQPISAPYPTSWPASGFVFRELLHDWIQIGAVVARTGAIQKIGGFDEALEAGEDWDLLLRLALSTRMGFVPQPSVIFRVHPTGTDEADAREKARAKLNARVFLRNARRAGRQRPPLPSLIRSYYRFLGVYAGSLVNSSQKHLQNNDRVKARRALRWALQVSPGHFFLGLLFRQYWRGAIFQAYLPRPSWFISPSGLPGHTGGPRP
jgi:glycosyltransferase involved in cell wall biosynthesis